MSIHSDQAADAVSNRTFIVARTADGMAHDQGRVITYTDAPTFEIERPDGTRFSWRADMCDPLAHRDLEQLLHGLLDAPPSTP